MVTPVKALNEIQLDEYGLLKNTQDWNHDIALVIARDLDIKILTTDHWKVIDAMRKHYNVFGVAPAIHNICHANHKSEEWVHELFGTCLNAWRVAGLPDPGEEAKTYLNDM